MILPFKLDWQGVELVHEFLEPLRIGAAEFVNTLVGVGQGNDPAAASKLADHRPFVGVRVLELVHDEYRVGRCVDTCQPPAAAQQFSRQLGEEVEVEQPLFMEKAQLLLVMLLLGKVSQARGALGRW